MKKAAQVRRDAKKLFRLCLVNGMLDDDRVRIVVQQVLKSRRRGHLAMMGHFMRLLKLDLAMHTAMVESAEPLSADLRDRVQDGLKSAYGPGMNTSFAQNPELIGGMRMKVGSDVYDGSVRAGLDALEKSFESGVQGKIPGIGFETVSNSG